MNAATPLGAVSFPLHTAFWPANAMWRKLLHSGFHTPKAVAYHEPTVMWLFVIGHSLGRVETCFGPSTQGAGIRYQNTSQIQILLASHFEKKGARCKNVRLAGLCRIKGY